MSLLDSSLLETGYQLGLNVGKFYTCPSLLKELSQLQIGAGGTVRPNKSGFSETTVNDLPKRVEISLSR